MTEPRRRTEVRALVRAATAYLAQQAAVDGSYFELVVAGASMTLDVASRETRALIAEEIRAEAEQLASRTAAKEKTPKASSAEATA